jgi:flagellin-specific chaperone FliS
VAELAAEASRRFDLARQALRDGDWTRYGNEMKRVEEILAEIRRLSSG